MLRESDAMSDPTLQHEVTFLIQAASASDRAAADRLFALVYDQLRKNAQQRMNEEHAGHTLQATALVHEAYLRLVGDKEVHWQGRGHFFAAAAEAMRRILIEHARARGRIKRGGDGAGRPPKRLPIPLVRLDEPDLAVQRIEADESLAAGVRRTAVELAPLVLFEERAYVNETIISVRYHYGGNPTRRRPWDQSLRLIDIAVAAYPDEPTCLALKGMVLCILERWGEANDALGQASERMTAAGTPGSALMLASWAGALARTGKLEEADATLKAARGAALDSGGGTPWTRGALEWADAELRAARSSGER